MQKAFVITDLNMPIYNIMYAYYLNLLFRQPQRLAYELLVNLFAFTPTLLGNLNAQSNRINSMVVYPQSDY